MCWGQRTFSPTPLPAAPQESLPSPRVSYPFWPLQLSCVCLAQTLLADMAWGGRHGPTGALALKPPIMHPFFGSLFHVCWLQGSLASSHLLEPGMASWPGHPQER
jgi:hypothetical protein